MKNYGLVTPKNSLSVLAWTLLIYLTAPIFEWIALTNELASGALPVNADSIGIPFGGFAIVWLFLLPFVIGFITRLSQKYPSQVSLFGYNAERPFWSFFWTLFFGFLAFDNLAVAFSNFRENYLVGVIQPLLLVYLSLLLRASIVFRSKENI